MEGFEWLRKLRSSMGKSKASEPDSTWPEWYQRYFRATPNKPADEVPLEELPIVIIDAETTGLDVKKDRLLSIGALRALGNSLQIADHFEGYLPTPPDQQDARAVHIHGIIPGSRRYDYLEEEELMEGLLEFIGERTIVGHHIGFDVEMINRALERLGAGPLRNRVIDTADLAKRIQPSGYWSPPEKYSLDTLARRYRIPLSDRHTALGDAYITGVLWLKLKGRLLEKVGRALTVGDL
ncbi:PolC-type DNA polymerase III [Neolewinella agarilytica]|uniref:3'-5' exonuclease n=1 Tax=Neolewinella agarilytica TaxID=478744 RepID=UPI002352CCA7|nr:3'-5' exonuclease [Neolewinella agarilytica]